MRLIRLVVYSKFGNQKGNIKPNSIKLNSMMNNMVGDVQNTAEWLYSIFQTIIQEPSENKCYSFNPPASHAEEDTKITATPW